MYMQALLGPAMVGRQMLLVQVTLDSISEIKRLCLISTADAKYLGQFKHTGIPTLNAGAHAYHITFMESD